MKKILLPTAILLLLTSVPVACSKPPRAVPTIVTGSSLITAIVQQVGGDDVNVLNIIPPAQHPGDFSPKPGDIQALHTATVFILHGWPGEGYADKLIQAADNPGLLVFKCNVEGNWMIPSVQKAAADKIAEILSQVDAANATDYGLRAASYKTTIDAEEVTIRARLTPAGVDRISVIASIRQADFLQWAGFNVVGTYGDPTTLTPQAVKDLVDKGKAGGVTLVVDNLQSGAEAGKGIAEELGATRLALSNFPGGFDDTGTWAKAIAYNVTLLVNAVQRSGAAK
jgi:zinc transport system substrate-binding protein